MSDEIENPPAFPVTPCYDQGVNMTYSGMTLRDWFAGQAYQAAWDSMDKGYYEGNNADIAECAYQMADAMLKARQS